MTDDEIEQGERYSTGEFGNSDLTVRVNFGRFDLLSYWLHHLVDRYQQQQIKQQLQQNLLQKTPEELATMKKARENLTKREIEILDLIAAGESNQEIADKLGISYRTVVNHVYNIFNKLGIHSRAEAIHFAISTSIAHQQADKD
jgi:DNA-binding NarL/FixJ family response regulator